MCNYKLKKKERGHRLHANPDAAEYARCASVCVRRAAVGPVRSGAVPAPTIWRPALDWVIVGGESGPKARVCNVSWILDIVRECERALVPVFVKQLGRRPACPAGTGDNPFPVAWPDPTRTTAQHDVMPLFNSKGGDPDEWLPDLRVRQMPKTWNTAGYSDQEEPMDGHKDPQKQRSKAIRARHSGEQAPGDRSITPDATPDSRAP